MKWDDKEYVTYLKAKYQGITNVQLNSSGLLYLKNSLEFYFNTTSKEIQRYLDSQWYLILALTIWMKLNKLFNTLGSVLNWSDKLAAIFETNLKPNWLTCSANP